ncbi:hypothetical protein Q3G72_008772 [Acer saccharum]|nr:hypothetical protein Q3G72_008772 [Acer saccharum]
MNHSLLQFVKKANSLKSFKSIHSHLIISGTINSSDLILNKLLRIYSRFGAIDYGRKLFDEIPKPNEFLWTALIHGYVENYRYAEAFSMFVRMLSESVTPLNFTIASVLKSLAREKRVNEGKGIYGFVLKSGFSFDLIVQNSVLDLFMRCGETDFARWAFDEMDEKDVVSWNTMVSGYGYAKNGQPRNALELYKSFKEQGIKPDETFILGIISACSQLGILDTAESIIHDFSEPSFFPNLRVVNSLIDMYAKCGSIKRAKQVFEMAHQKDLLCYSTMIAAFANNGLGQEAISLFDEMQRANIRPDGVAFLVVLTACNHGGLVNEGKMYFKQMIDEYGIPPSEKHYACVVDLLGRSGCLDEAHNIIKNMPIAPHSAVWGALLAACRVHCNVQLAEIASAELFKIEPYNSGNYVLLSNTYAAAGLWDDVARVRKMVKERRVRKNRGSSWIDVGCTLHEFVLGDTSHSDSESMYFILNLLSEDMKILGYTLDTEKTELAVGTFTLEFGVLSRLTNDSIFEQVTKNAMLGIWARRSKRNLVGAHINVFTGEWTQKDAGIGTSIDSFYEYLLKAKVNMDSAAIVWPLFNSLQAFWPGLQHGQKSYPLRPELIESTYWLYKATKDPRNIFSTEGHLLPATPQISLAKEHCSYYGAYCKSGDSKEKYDTLDVSDEPQETNGSKVFGDRSHTGFPSDSFFGSIPATGLIKQGFCPGLTHGQKYGITYLASEVRLQPKKNQLQSRVILWWWFLTKLLFIHRPKARAMTMMLKLESGTIKEE